MPLSTLVKDPLPFMAIGLVGMFLAAWLFDRASLRFFPQAKEIGSKPRAPSVLRLGMKQVGGALVAILVFVALYRTSLLFADGLLVVAAVAFAVASYHVRLKPLALAGATAAHLSVLVLSLSLWVLPMAWFVHLHLAGVYGAF